MWTAGRNNYGQLGDGKYNPKVMGSERGIVVIMGMVVVVSATISIRGRA